MLLCCCTGQSKHWERVAKPALTDIKDGINSHCAAQQSQDLLHTLTHTHTIHWVLMDGAVMAFLSFWIRLGCLKNEQKY